MFHLVDAAFDRIRVTLLALIMFVVLGILSFIHIPREADPDIPLPIVMVALPLPGIAPEDAERLLLKPSEKELRALEGLVQMDGIATAGLGRIVLEFENTVDVNQAIADTREAIDRAKISYPTETKEPIIDELNAQSLFPIVSVVLSGSAPERTLRREAERLQDRLLQVPGVLDASLSGARDEVFEMLILPETMDAYGISEQEIAIAIRNNNVLIPAGRMRFENAAFAIKLPGLIKTAAEAKEIPLRYTADGDVITLGDIAQLRRGFEDPTGYTLLNGAKAIGINIDKRAGANIIDVTNAIKHATQELAASWPESIHYRYIGEQAIFVHAMLANLVSSIALAIFLVMIVVIATLGLRSSLMVGIAIPCSFLIGFTFLSFGSNPLNVMTMFGLILSVGMLVDSAIVIVEYADRRMLEGASRRAAYIQAAKRMFWPITASTATTLAAFLPFLFWNSIEGDYMRYLPLTMMFVLSGSWLVALIFLPMIGAHAGLPKKLKQVLSIKGKTDGTANVDLENVDPDTLTGLMGFYVRFISTAIKHPLLTISSTIVVLFGIFQIFKWVPPPVEFFTDTDSPKIMVLVQARGNVSEENKITFATEVVTKIIGHPAIRDIYIQTAPEASAMNDVPVETVAHIMLDLVPYAQRKPSYELVEELRAHLGDFAGLVIEVRAPPNGPERGKDIDLEITSDDFEVARQVTQEIRHFLDTHKTQINGKTIHSYMDIEDSQTLPGIELNLRVDREEAGRFGVSLAELGTMVQLVTDGILIDTLHLDDAIDEIEIRLRFPKSARTITTLQDLRIQTQSGPLPVSNFVQLEPRQQLDRINRRNGQRVMDIRANGNTRVPGHTVSQDKAIQLLVDWLESGALNARVSGDFTWDLRGTSEDQQAATQFLQGAMLAALFMIGVILLLQYNNAYHALITLSMVVMSVFGVMLGVTISGSALSVILTGTGIVALAGIVVNNNIVLIDTFNYLHRSGLPVVEAVIRTTMQRVRPVLLTTGTTIFGLLPMMFEINVAFVQGRIGIGSEASAYWVQLSSAIVYGLAFATLLTLIVTPVLIAAPNVISNHYQVKILPLYKEKIRHILYAYFARSRKK